MEVVFELCHSEPVNRACLSFQIVNQTQQPATHLWVFDSDRPYARHAGRTRLRCRIPKVRLNVGEYALKVYFSEPPGGQTFEVLESICRFEVVVLDETTPWGWRSDTCVYREDAGWEVEDISDSLPPAAGAPVS
jgi:lipopolysaccharide transport system ATP-binding protein